MYNGKMHYYEGNTFGGVAVKQNDIVLENGVIHILSSQIPYSYNIREYIDTHSSTSKLHSLNLLHIVQVDTGKRIVAWNPCSEGL